MKGCMGTGALLFLCRGLGTALGWCGRKAPGVPAVPGLLPFNMSVSIDEDGPN
jgi:hypothetical protein